MRQVRAWAGILALLVAWGQTTASAAEPDSPSWFQRVFGSSEADTPAPTAEATPPTPALSPREHAADVLTAAREEYLRRLAVCDRFREIALRSQNDHLLNQADRWEQQATEVYQRKIAHLPVSRLKPLPEENTDTALESRTLLDERLGTGVAVHPLNSVGGAGESRPAMRAEASIRGSLQGGNR